MVMLKASVWGAVELCQIILKDVIVIRCLAHYVSEVEHLQPPTLP